VTPRAYMIIGALAGSTALLADWIGSVSVSLLGFAAGALFGKGYGVWEERSRTALKALDAQGGGDG